MRKIIQVRSRDNGVFEVGEYSWSNNFTDFGKVTEIREMEATCTKDMWIIPKQSTFTVYFDDGIHTIELFDATLVVREK